MSNGGLNQTHVGQYYHNRNQIKSRRKHYIDRVYKLKSKGFKYTKTTLKTNLSKLQIENNKQSVRNQMRQYQLLGWIKTIGVLVIIGLSIYLFLPQINAFGQLLTR
jgi:hypothetical protein